MPGLALCPATCCHHLCHPHSPKQGQVLLSCSHTFHQRCLAAWEAHSGERRCPLCRCAAYEKRRVETAAAAWRETCATRIQAAWRGARAQRQYAALRRLLPPQHPALRRRWCAERLEEGSAALVGSVDAGAAEVEALFAELDASRAARSSVFTALAQRCCALAAAQGSGVAAAAADVAVEAAGRAGAGQPAAAAAQPRSNGGAAAGATAGPAAAAGFDWEAVLDRCLQRDAAPECSICLCSLGELGSAASPSGGVGAGASACSTQPRRRQRPANGSSSIDSSRGAGARDATSGSGGLAVTSCSHAFHAGCLSAFEAFAVASERAPACPVCRAAYQRLDLV